MKSTMMPNIPEAHKGLCQGYLSKAHQARFEAGREKYRPGGELAARCGANTNSGKVCTRHPVADGNGRCIQHCGQIVARQYRQRQYDKFTKGQVSSAVWFKAEQKRAVNRLREKWKKDPWVPGCTIDLDEHEEAFRQTLKQDPDMLPAAVADWLRWRYRRLQIDRNSDAGWAKVLREDLPVRISAAGEMPNGDAVLDSLLKQTAAPLWRVEPRGQFSKRNNADRPSQRSAAQVDSQARNNWSNSPTNAATPASAAPQCETGGEDNRTQQLVKVNCEHQATLAPLYARCPGERDRVRVLSALADYVAAPDDTVARANWTATLADLSK